MLGSTHNSRCFHRSFAGTERERSRVATKIASVPRAYRTRGSMIGWVKHARRKLFLRILTKKVLPFRNAKDRVALPAATNSAVATRTKQRMLPNNRRIISERRALRQDVLSRRYPRGLRIARTATGSLEMSLPGEIESVRASSPWDIDNGASLSPTIATFSLRSWLLLYFACSVVSISMGRGWNSFPTESSRFD